MGAPRITGKAGENGQYAGAGRHPGQDRRLPSVVTHPKPQRASARSWVATRATWLRGRYRLGHWLVALRRTETAQCRVRPTKGQVRAAAPHRA